MTEALSPYALLKRAREAMYTLPEGFSGFEAGLFLRHRGVGYRGFLRVEGFTPRVDLPEEVRPVAEGELASMLGHRRPRPFHEGEGRYAMRVEEEGPMGVVVALEDPFRSRIWVREGRLALIERHLEGKSFRIHLEEFAEAKDGRLLPRRFTVVHREGGRIVRVERFLDEYQPLGDLHLPVAREVVVEGPEGLSFLALRLEGFRLLEG
ncbi:Protein of unknown function (DUF3386) (plasmid) [Thermus oshimai JL-2]|uniref:Uncharacterized protein n=1 Tax=Thermus oshimai JL-2 TaxID=751945 RepID=K7R8G3_THEOS|nr:DUF3386 family protein [Thermus oshimai]AFV77349.1 Protein of unknown function (DUF3386) [Thermus oshimai JL-2]